MTYCKTNFILSIVIIAATGSGCKKNNNGDGSSAPLEKRAVVTTIAGDGTDGYANGPALSAKFHSPVDVAVAADGTIYVADYNSHRIRKIAAGMVSTLAGNDTAGFVNGDGESAQFRDPYSLTLDAGGNVYVLDQVDPRIRKISPAGYVTTYAGSDHAGFLDGAALMAQFHLGAEGIASDGQGNIYVDDTFNERIRKITTAAQVSTYAGSGTRGFMDGDAGTAQFNYPAGIAFDPQGNLYVADAGNFCIRKITPAGVVSRFAGTGTEGNTDGAADVAQFNVVIDIVADSHGNLYVAEGRRIRKITPGGVVSTIAGSIAGYADGDGSIAQFGYIGGLGIDAHGNIYVADEGNNRIRKISFE